MAIRFHWYALNTLYIQVFEVYAIVLLSSHAPVYIPFCTCLCVSPSPPGPVKTAEDDTLIRKYLLPHPGNTRCGLDSPSKIIEQKLERLLRECSSVQVCMHQYDTKDLFYCVNVARDCSSSWTLSWFCREMLVVSGKTAWVRTVTEWGMLVCIHKST